MGSSLSNAADAPSKAHSTPCRRAVVVPFAVPDEGRDLGLGLAALLHAFARLDGENVALAQLLTREAGAESRPVEALVSPTTWRELAGRGATHDNVSMVVTGLFEPPTDGRGLLQLVAFDPKSGRARAEIEVGLEADTAGAGVLGAIESLCDTVGGEPGLVRDISDLAWEALESVLRAERCILHNPLRGGPHDRLAALVHLGRAIADAPSARFPAGRLASIALDTVLSRPEDAKIVAAALRALERAVIDAPEHTELHEATAALHMRAGAPDVAESHVLRALTHDARRPRLYALLSETRRARGDLDGADAAVAEGLTLAPEEPLLLTEQGVVALERGAVDTARRRFTAVLERAPGYPPAFLNLLGCAARTADTRLLEDLAFQAAELESLPADVARRVLRLYMAMPSTEDARRGPRERAECTARLAARLVAEGCDAWAELTLARAQVDLGELESARVHLTHVEESAPASAMAAEARRARFALERPTAALELESVVREAHTRDKEELVAVSARAKSLAHDNDVWTAHFALGMTERRRERWQEARIALETAVAKSPGATPAHIELVAVHVALGSAQKALEHADRACALEGETARTLAVRATALLAASRHADARDAIDRALALDSSDLAHRALADRIHATLEPSSALARLREVFRFKKR